MPVIPLEPDMIGPKYASLGIGALAGVMLWPNDDEARHEVNLAVAADGVREWIRSHSPDERLELAHEWETWADWLIEARPMTEIWKKLRKPLEEGSMVGAVARWAMDEARETGIMPKIQPIKMDVLEHFRDMRLQHSQIESTAMESIWKAYRRCAHLWVAFCEMTGRRNREEMGFPCLASQLPAFIVLAQSAFDCGSQLRLRQRTETLFWSDDPWTFSDELIRSVMPQPFGPTGPG